MTNPVILLGTQSNGETLPVQVDATGRLVAEGLPGEPGAPGEPGPPGEQGPPGPEGETDLPPNPEEGQVLGWKDGELAWLDHAGGGFFFELDYLVLGGGGNRTGGYANTFTGGGAGGFISSVEYETNPGGNATPGALRIPIDENGVLAQVVVGGPGRDSTFMGPGWLYTAYSGGTGGDGASGASGAGGSCSTKHGGEVGPGGAGIATQGNPGADGGAAKDAPCYGTGYWCNPVCTVQLCGGGGGGAGGPADGINGGPGLSSSITGSSLIYSTGGGGGTSCAGEYAVAGTGHENYGSGAGGGVEAKSGAVILRYPNWIELNMRTGDLNIDSQPLNDLVVSTCTGGYGSLQFKIKPGGRLAALKRRIKRDQKTL